MTLEGGRPTVAINASERFDEVFRAEYPRVVAVARLIVGRSDAAREIAQEAFVALLARGVGSVEDPGAWLRTVAYRRALNLARQQRRERGALDAVGRERALQPRCEGPVLGPDPQLQRSLSSLSLNQRSAALLVWGDGLSAGEAGAVLGCSAATVRVHLHRARRALARDLAPDPVDNATEGVTDE